MAKQKKKPINNKISQPQKFNNQNTLSFSTPLAPATQPLVGQKRKIADLSHFIKKEESVSPPTVQKKYFIQQFLKQKSISIQVLALQCPNFQAAILQIYHATGIDKSLIYSTVQSYFHGSKHQLWSDKYTPKNLKQCLHRDFGEKILKWIRIYMNYRNCYPEESNSLFDYFGDGNSNSQYKCLKENGWKLRGLILKGRSGVGKSTLIHATAKQMECEIFNCGNECNQIKYLRERNEATQSECVKTKINKNQAQIQKTNKTLTSFATKVDESQMQPQSKRIQFMHNVNDFYPRQEEAKFFNELNKTIESSKIPFLMTLTGETVPQSLKIYDIMEFEEAKTQDIARLLFLISNVEKAFSSCLNLEKVIEKEKFKEELNQQFKNFQFFVETTFEDFLKLTEISNKKLDFLLTFIQNSTRLSKQLNLVEAENLMKEYLRRSNGDNLMNEYFYSSQSQILGKQEADSTQDFIDPKYLLSPQNDQKLQNQTQILESTSSNSKKRAEPIFSKNIEQEIAKIEIKHEKSLKKMIKELQMKAIHDYKPEVQNDECFIFSKLYNQQREELEQKLIHNISIIRHQQIRKKITKNVKRQFYTQNELTTSLKAKQLNFIGFLIDSRSRISRKKINKEEMNFKKYLKNNEINYLKSFTAILKPGSSELKL